MLKGMNYKKAEDYLNSFINYEKKVFSPYEKSFKLERMRFLLEYLDVSYQRMKVIHVAGTKGKGSTATFCAYILAALGYKAGLYTSPHLFSFRERIKIVKSSKGKGREAFSGVKSFLISKKDVVEIVEKFKVCLERTRFTKELGQPSFFEVYTAIAFKYFIYKDVDFVVLETGLGGRLDATNVVNPLVSVITHIGYDHTNKLGSKLADIAYEKAGIIKRNVPLVCSYQRESSLKVIKNKCVKNKVSLFLLGKDFFTRNMKLRKDRTLFDFEFQDFKINNLETSLKGKYQVENAGCALAAISLLKKQGSNSKVEFRKGVSSCFLEGRFELVKKNPLVIMDIAHNLSSFSALRENLRFYFPNKKIILIFACSKDKDVKKMLKSIDYSYLILTQFHPPRSRKPQEMKEFCGLKYASTAEDICEAFGMAKKIYRKDFAIVVSGSLFLVAEAKAFLYKSINN